MSDYNNFRNPVGSLPSGLDRVFEEARQLAESTNPDNTQKIRGTGGSVRHSGVFSENNPYLSQLNSASKNQDIDALYEYAVQWEADYANRQMQLEENKEILAEQREYDSPVARMAREREAGINPDLGGSSSGGSSSSQAQLTNPGMADQSGQTKFSNAYDNAALVFEGINTASNFANSLSSGVSGIMNAVSNMKMVPSQIALNEANASLGSAKANEINELLAGNKKSLDLSNTFQGIRNGTAILQQLAEFSNLIAPDTADFAPILKSLGVEEANIAPYSDIIKQMHANPQMRDKYAKAETSAKWSEAENTLYTQAVVGEMVDLQYRMAYEQQYWQFHTSHLQGQIAALLDTDKFAQRSADNIISEAGLQAQAINVQNKELNQRVVELKHNTETLLQGIQDRAAALRTLAKAREKLTPKDRPLTGEEQAIINRINAEEIALRNLLAGEFYKIKTSYLNVAQQLYNNYHRLDQAGNLRPAAALEVGNMFSDAVFNDLIYHTKTPGEIAKGWVDTTISAAGVAVDAAGVARGYGFNQVYKQVHDGRQFRAGYAAGQNK